MAKGKETRKDKKAVKKDDSSKKASSKTSTATKTATATKTSTSTDAYTQGNITVTGGAGKGATSVKIGLPGGSLKNNAKKAEKAKGKK
jgi:hypothetical protein